MAKVKVPIYGSNRVGLIDEGATVGATLGVDLRDETGKVVTLASLVAAAAEEARRLILTETAPRNDQTFIATLLIDPATGVLVIDCTFAEQFRLVLTRDVTAIQFINVPTVKVLVIEIVQPPDAIWTIEETAWPPSVSFVSGIVYVPSQAMGAIDTVGIQTINAGQNWAVRTSQVVNPGTGGIDPGGGNPTPPPGGGLAVTLEPSPAFGFCFVTVPNQCAPSVQVTANVTGGTPPYTFLWTRISGSTAIVPNSTSIANPTFSAPNGGTNLSWQGRWRCTVQDADGAIKAPEVDIQLERGNDL